MVNNATVKNIWFLKDVKRCIVEAAKTKRVYRKENEPDPYRELARCISYLTSIGKIKWIDTSTSPCGYNTFRMFVADIIGFRIILMWLHADGWPTLLITADTRLRSRKIIENKYYEIHKYGKFLIELNIRDISDGKFLIELYDYEVEKLWEAIKESTITDYLPPSFSRNMWVIK